MPANSQIRLPVAFDAAEVTQAERIQKVMDLKNVLIEPSNTLDNNEMPVDTPSAPSSFVDDEGSSYVASPETTMTEAITEPVSIPSLNDCTQPPFAPPLQHVTRSI